MRIILATLGVWVAAQWFDLADKVPTGRGTVFLLSFAVGAFPLIIWRLVANILKRLPGAFLAGGVLSDGRRGKNTRHLLTGLFRQSVFGRLAGYEDVNDADRLAHDPAMRAVVDRGGLDRVAASTSQMGRFETAWLTSEANLAALADLSGAWIDRVHERKPQTTIVLDMDSSVSETHGAQEGTAYNGHFACTCYHPLFVFNQFGDLERCALRPGNVHSADGWREVLEPVIARYRHKMKRRYFRGDAAFANPEVYELLEAEGYKYTIRLPDQLGPAGTHRLAAEASSGPAGHTRCAATMPASATKLAPGPSRAASWPRWSGIPVNCIRASGSS